MPVQVSCKFDEGPVKNELRRYLIHNIFSIIRLRENFQRSRASNFYVLNLIYPRNRCLIYACGTF